MCDECHYCGRAPWAVGELRMAPDASLSGAPMPCCSDCYEGDDWAALQTTEEFNTEWAALREMALDDMAHAARDWGLGL